MAEFAARAVAIVALGVVAVVAFGPLLSATMMNGS
jgi:hypothetical protein